MVLSRQEKEGHSAVVVLAEEGKKKLSINRGGKHQAITPVGASYKDPQREGREHQSSQFDVLGDNESDGGE